jgi:hypothetical protein
VGEGVSGWLSGGEWRSGGVIEWMGGWVGEVMGGVIEWVDGWVGGGEFC